MPLPLPPPPPGAVLSRVQVWRPHRRLGPRAGPIRLCRTEHNRGAQHAGQGGADAALGPHQQVGGRAAALGGGGGPAACHAGAASGPHWRHRNACPRRLLPLLLLMQGDRCGVCWRRGPWRRCSSSSSSRAGRWRRARGPAAAARVGGSGPHAAAVERGHHAAAARSVQAAGGGDGAGGQQVRGLG